MTTAVTILFGTTLAYMLARWKFRLRSWIELLIDLPIVLPPSVAGLVLLMAFGRRGIFGQELSRPGNQPAIYHRSSHHCPDVCCFPLLYPLRPDWLPYH